MKQNRSIKSYFLLLTISICFQNVFTETETKLGNVDDEEDSEDIILNMRNDPSDTSSSQRDAISKASQVIRLGFSEQGECPHSCFCETEESYISCIGDGQWNPPLIPSSLDRLELRSFFIPELETSSIHLQGLKELQLQQCNLSKLHEDAFSKVTTLDRLDLSRNHVESLGPNQLRGLSLLKHLDLSSNTLKILNRPFTFLTELEHLNLRTNKLEKLDADTFDGLDKVQYVNLDGNNISSVSVASFQHLGSLAHLILSNNPLSNLARLNFFGSRLQYIDISNIGIEKVPQALTQFVRDLRLAKNNVREIHRGDLDSYPYLGLLVLDDNGLEILEEDALGRHEYLARLWLNGNKLKAVPQSLPLSLKALYIEENSITSLSDNDFAGLSNLEEIFMQRNKISNINKCTFCDLVNLKTLDLQANNITNITQSIFQKLVRLETLDLSQNPFTVLNGNSFKGLSYIRVLQFSRIHSNISISENLLDPLKSLQILEMYGSPTLVKAIVKSTRLLHSLRSIKELNIMHNEISMLRKDFFSFFPKLSLIKISGNTWDCSIKENVFWLKNLIQNSQTNFHRSFSIRCSKPLSLDSKPILLLEESDFPELKSSTTTMKTAEFGQNTSWPSSNTLGLRSINSFTYLNSKIRDATFSRNESKESSLIDHQMESPIDSVKTLPLPFNEPYDQDDDNLYDEVIDVLPQMENASTLTISTTTTTTIIDATIVPLTKKFKIDKENHHTSIDVRVLSDPSEEKDVFQEISSNIFTTLKPPYWSIYNRRPEKNNKRKRLTFTNSNKNALNSSKSMILINETLEDKMLQNKSQKPKRVKNDLWLYRKDASHALVQERKGVSVHSMQTKHNALLVGAGIVSACTLIVFIIGSFILAKGISRKKRRMNIWENSRSSYWSWREGDEGESISEGVVVGIGETGMGITRETEGTVEVVTESHHGLNNRLYLLLQRDSSTGITPETLPDPTVVSSPSIISSEKLNNNNKTKRNTNQNSSYNNMRFLK